MALEESHLPPIVTEITSHVASVCSSLTQNLKLARRCTEGFKSTFQQWLQLRFSLADNFSYLQEILMFNNVNQYQDSYCCCVQLIEKLRRDTDMVQELLTLFDEYLSYIAKIKTDFDDACSRNLNDTLVKLMKSEEPGFLESEIPVRDNELFQIIPILKHMDLLSVGKNIILREMLENLNYLLYHWDIIKALNDLNNTKDQKSKMNAYLDIIPQDPNVSEKNVCYDDLVYNLTISSTAYIYIEKLLNLNKEDFEGQIDEICNKLNKIQREFDYTTQKIGLFNELLITGT